MNDALWSIPIEVHFYLMFPVVFYLIYKLRKYLSAYLSLLIFFLLIAVFQWTFLCYASDIEKFVGDLSLFSASMWSVTKNSGVLFAHFLIGVVFSRNLSTLFR